MEEAVLHWSGRILICVVGADIPARGPRGESGSQNISQAYAPSTCHTVSFMTYSEDDQLAAGSSASSDSVAIHILCVCFNQTYIDCVCYSDNGVSGFIN